MPCLFPYTATSASQTKARTEVSEASSFKSVWGGEEVTSFSTSELLTSQWIVLQVQMQRPTPYKADVTYEVLQDGLECDAQEQHGVKCLYSSHDVQKLLFSISLKGCVYCYPLYTSHSESAACVDAGTYLILVPLYCVVIYEALKLVRFLPYWDNTRNKKQMPSLLHILHSLF